MTSLNVACHGVETIITTATSAARGGTDTPQTVDFEGNRNLIDAAKAAGVTQLIFVSAQIADPRSPIPFLAAKGKTEEYLRASGVPYTIIAPNAFMESWIGLLVGMPALEGEPVTLVGDGKRRHSFVSMADVAQFVVASINHPAALNHRLVIGGPQARSFRDAVAVYERIIGRPIVVRSVQPGEPIPALPEAAWPIAASFEQFDSPIEMEYLAHTFDVKLTSLEEFVRRSVERDRT
jgi:NADH dehydrogenase